jgi:hypothetical protein
MRQRNQNPKNALRQSAGSLRQRGQALLEATLILLVFLATLLSALDFGQVLFTHQMLVERVRAAVRWAAVRQWDDANSPDQIRNMVLYNSPTAPDSGSAFFGMTPSHVSVVRTPPPAPPAIPQPDEDRITVSIVNFQFHFFSPWLARTYTSNGGIVETTPVLFRP